ncbi:hypothetical protein [Terrihabitans rhizophilus]|uniref:Replication protein n=1 Tax=Terrihabitans rhizophilus TaxID=3092662 RepID=A0ABU4RMW9_9HYPH|nr:hypothetical protein [Terrihabitans sp. PJ23]MDX6806159.1 hypothetical protein [Terrihabitans sp. PJ23]
MSIKRDRKLVLKEILHGDGPPYWRQGKANRPCQTSEEAAIERRKLVKVLRRHGKQDAMALSLAEKLNECRPLRRCASGACPECGRAAQRRFVGKADESARLHAVARYDNMMAVTIIPTAPDTSAVVRGSIRAAKYRVLRALHAAKINTFIGGVDVSYNETAPFIRRDDAADPSPRRSGRCAHVYVVIPQQAWFRAEALIRALFPRTPDVPRPIKADRFNGDLRAFAYCVKTTFDRRVTIPKHIGKEGRTVCRNTRDRDLLAWQKVELALHLDEVGLTSRWLLSGIPLMKPKPVSRSHPKSSNTSHPV